MVQSRNDELDLSVVDFGLDIVHVVCRVELVNVLRDGRVLNTHSFVGVANPIVFGPSNSSVADFGRKEASVISKSALPQRVGVRGSDRVCQKFGLHVLDIFN